MTSSHPNRREAIVGLGALSATALGIGAASAQEGARGVLPLRGVVYDTGTYFGYEGYLSRMSWHESDVRAEIAAIRNDLHCNTIQIVGTNFERLETASAIAREHGMQIWLQPRLMESSADEQLAHMTEGAEVAARLADAGADIVFSVGCETTLFQRGLVPGETFAERIQPLFSATGDEAERIRRELNAYLQRAAEAARTVFAGPLTYSAGSWEAVDWSAFDFAGLNLYRDRNNRANYREVLRSHTSHGKPLVITEFGLCTFEGASQYGGGGFMIVDYSTQPPTIPEGFVRSEEEQAREIAELIEIYAEEGVEGAFVFVFLSQFDVHSSDPRFDLDMASHAIVKVGPAGLEEPVHWEPKLAFHEIARLYETL